MLIREATPADILQIIALGEQSDTAAHWRPREYGALFAPEAPKRLCLIAAEPGEVVVGFAIARCLDDEWELENIVVDVRCRLQGIGRQLLAELLDCARRANALAVLLEVRESNVAARHLYAKLGFSEFGRRRNYYNAPVEDALLLRLGLQVRDKTP